MIIGVFGDVHGAFGALYGAAQRWEMLNSKEIHYVLIAGDLNCFPDLSRIDRATRNFGREDPTNFGTQEYILGGKIATKKTYFVRGNHEDFDFLKTRKNKPIDPHGMIVNVEGPLQLEDECGDVCRIYGLGGIQPESAAYTNHPEKAGREYISEREFRNALNYCNAHKFQILLTHDGPVGYSLARKPDVGSQWIAELVAKAKPRVHFFGHYNKPPVPGRVGITEESTLIVPLNQTDDRYYHLPKRDSCFAVLDTSDWTVGFADREIAL